MVLEKDEKFLIKVRVVPAEQELRKVNVDLHCAAVGTQGVVAEHKARVFIR
jgi:hypothetical protein